MGSVFSSVRLDYPSCQAILVHFNSLAMNAHQYTWTSSTNRPKNTVIPGTLQRITGINGSVDERPRYRPRAGKRLVGPEY